MLTPRYNMTCDALSVQLWESLEPVKPRAGGREMRDGKHFPPAERLRGKNALAVFPGGGDFAPILLRLARPVSGVPHAGEPRPL